MHILVIDDDVLMRNLITDVLQNANHTVVEASNGVEGLAANEARPADLFILDLYMPQMDGIEFLIKLKGQRSDAKIITITGVVGRGSDELLMAAKHLGSTLTLRKPFTSTELLDLVNTAFGDSPAKDS